MNVFYGSRASGLLYRFVKNNPLGYYILPANVCPVVPLTIKKAGADVIFVDISRESLLIDYNQCEKLISYNNNCVGVVVVATYGCYHGSWEIVSELKKKHSNILVIEDRCLSIPSDVNYLHGDVDLVLYSSGYAKVCDIGYGGIALTTSNLSRVQDLPFEDLDYEELCEKYKYCFEHNLLMEDYNGLNWLDTTLLDDKQSDEYKLALNKNLNNVLSHKASINNIYKNRLPSNVSLGNDWNIWRYNIMVKSKRIILREIFNRGLFASTHYQPSALLFGSTEYPNAHALYDRVINLFNDKYIRQDQALEICDIINKYNK